MAECVINEFTHQLGKAVSEGAPFEGRLGFDLGVVGAILIEGTSVVSSESDLSDDVDCLVCLSAETLRALLNGDLTPTEAFRAGQLVLKGELSVAVKMASMLRQAREQSS